MKRILSLCLVAVMLLSTTLALAACGNGERDNGAVINAYYVGEMYDFDPARAAVDDDAMRVLALLYEPLFKLTSKGKVQGALAESYQIIRNEAEGEYKMEITLKQTSWSGGALVTASDVVFAWKRILDPTFKSQAAPLLYDIENAVEAKNAGVDEDGHNITIEDIGAVAVNKSVIQITFRKVYDEDGNAVEPNYEAFLRNLTSVALAPVCQSQLDKDGGAAADYWGKRSITIQTNGPFTVRTLDYNTSEFTIERNRYYGYADMTTPNTEDPTKFVTPYQFTVDWSTKTADLADLFANNSVFIMAELPLALREEMKDEATVSDLLSTMSILLNTTAPKGGDRYTTPLANPVIRRGLSEALDRETIADMLVFAKPATGFVADGVMDTLSRRSDFRKEGGALLNTKAVTVSAEFTAAVSALKEKQKELTLAYNSTEADKAVAEYVESVWEGLGFTVTLRPLAYNEESIVLDLGDGSTKTEEFRGSQLIDVYEDFAIGSAAEHLAAYRNNIGGAYHNDSVLSASYFDALLLDYQMLSPDPFAPLAGFSSVLSGNGVDLSLNGDGTQAMTPYYHVTGYQNDEYDELIAKAYGEWDLDARAEILHEAEELLLEDMPVIPLTFGQSYYVKSRKLRNVKTDYYGYPLLDKAKLKNYKDYLPVEE